jgi:hypothetical protein
VAARQSGPGCLPILSFGLANGPTSAHIHWMPNTPPARRGTTMRTLLVVAAIIGFSASGFAQTAVPKVGGKPLRQAKPQTPMGCKLIGTSRGPRFGPGTVLAQPSSGVPHHPRQNPRRPRRTPAPPTSNRRLNARPTVSEPQRVWRNSQNPLSEAARRARKRLMKVSYH